jgi:hypothetical protein
MKTRNIYDTKPGNNRTMTNKNKNESVHRHTNEESLEYSSSSTEPDTHISTQSQDPDNYRQTQAPKKGLSKNMATDI